MAGYFLLAILLNFLRFGEIENSRRNIITHIFDGATFAVSIALFAGILEPAVLILIGNLKIFLMISALVGIVYAIRQLFTH